MKRFLAIYIGTGAALEKSQWNKLDAEKRKALEASGRIPEPQSLHRLSFARASNGGVSSRTEYRPHGSRGDPRADASVQ
jgi:hypothetical protein